MNQKHKTGPAAIALATCGFILPGIANAQEIKDPLLRPDWINKEFQLHSSVASTAQKDRAGFIITDNAQREFMLRGEQIRYFPYDDLWKPVVVRSDQIRLHVAEAEGLLKRGHKTEAARILKSVQAYHRTLRNSAGDPKAARILSGLSEKESWFEIDRMSDPYALYFAEEDRTCVYSDLHFWSACLNGQWLFQPESLTRRDSSYHIAYMKSGSDSITLASYVHRYHTLDTPSVLGLWDLRRGWTVQRKKSYGIQRQKLDIMCSCDAYQSGIRPLELIFTEGHRSLFAASNIAADRYEQVFESISFTRGQN